MRRTAVVFAGVWATLGIVLAMPPSALYESPHTDLTYAYSVRTEFDDAETWQFSVPTKIGDLEVTIASDGSEFSVSTELGGGEFHEATTYSEPIGSGVAELAIAWPKDRRSARFADHGEPGRLEPLDGAMPSCEKLEEGELWLARNAALEFVQADFFAYSEAPRHLQMLLAGLQFGAVAPQIAGGCEGPQTPSVGACNADSVGFNECIQCCELESGITAALCNGVAQSICASPICRGFASMICGGMASFTRSYCVQYNCRGLSGDPSCNQHAPCEGTCMYFCGPGWGSGCGSCAGMGPFGETCCR